MDFGVGQRGVRVKRGDNRNLNRWPRLVYRAGFCAVLYQCVLKQSPDTLAAIDDL